VKKRTIPNFVGPPEVANIEAICMEEEEDSGERGGTRVFKIGW
jgi:hypothetical protein